MEIVSREGDFSYSEGVQDEEGSCCSFAPKSRNISERKRRKRLNEALLNLRSIVPNVSKMDKISVLKDAIDYIEKLHEEERAILEALPTPSRTTAENKTLRIRNPHAPPPIDVSKVQMSSAGGELSLVTIRFPRRKRTMERVCEAFKSLDLNIVSANMISHSDHILHCLLIKAVHTEEAEMQEKIKTKMAELDAQSDYSDGIEECEHLHI